MVSIIWKQNIQNYVFHSAVPCFCSNQTGNHWGQKEIRKNAHNTKIRSGSNRKRSPRRVQLDSGANEARADENDEHRTHRESNHCHHQINPAGYHIRPLISLRIMKLQPWIQTLTISSRFHSEKTLANGLPTSPIPAPPPHRNLNSSLPLLILKHTHTLSHTKTFQPLIAPTGHHRCLFLRILFPRKTSTTSSFPSSHSWHSNLACSSGSRKNIYIK